MKWCIPLIALLVLAGCGNNQSRQLTPEEQRRQKVEHHCRDVGRVAKAQADATLPDDAVTFAGGYARQSEINRAGRVAYQDCMAQYGYWP